MEIITLCSIIFLLALIISAAIFRLSALLWTITLGLGLCVITWLDAVPIRGIIFIWLCYLGAASFANLQDLRGRYITGPISKRIKQQLPAISETEREAINAGNTWW